MSDEHKAEARKLSVEMAGQIHFEYVNGDKNDVETIAAIAAALSAAYARGLAKGLREAREIAPIPTEGSMKG